MTIRPGWSGVRVCALGFGILAGSAAAQDAPIIQIMPRVENGGQENAAPTEPVSEAEPAIRDGAGQTAEGTAKQRLVPMGPLSPLPDTVRMGASLPQPGILRLTGEVAEIDLGLWLPQGVSPPAELVLSSRSSIDVLPDTAAMRVSVNGGPEQVFPVDHFDTFGQQRIDANGLVAGANRISLSLRQPHRIYCGPEASFDVWTELDLGRSGADMPIPAEASEAQGFAQAVAGQIASGRPLRLLADPATDPAILRQVTIALGAAMQGQGGIEIASFYEPAAAQGATVALIASGQSRVSYRGASDGAAALQIEYANNTLPDLGTALPPVPLAVSALPPLVTPGAPVTLADLGQPDLIGNTHYYRRDIAFRLPDDWLLLANQKAQISLHYGFADNLAEGAILLVKVNDETVRLLPLDRDGGRIVEPLDIPFGARLLRPGGNTLSFEMMVPGDPSDAACEPRQTDMLVVIKDSTVEVPRSPSMQLKGISTSLAGLTGAGIEVAPDAVDRATLERAAARFAAGLSGTENPDGQAKLLLVDIAGFPRSESGISVRTLQDALYPTPQVVSSAPAAAAPVAARYRLSDEAEPQETATAEKDATGPSFIQRQRDWLRQKREAIRDATFMSSGGSLEDWLQEHQGDALILPVDPARMDTLWLVLGPGAEIAGISEGLNSLRGIRLGEGKAALLSNDGSWQIWASPELPEVNETITPLNILPVLGNYASWSPLLFTVVILGFGLISIVPALIIVTTYRKRRLR